MTQLTEHAKSILRALADGKKIEYQDECHLKWWTASLLTCAKWISDDAENELRIAPETRSINGVEFAAPVDGHTSRWLGSLKINQKTYYFASVLDADTAALAICDAIEGVTK